MSQTVASQVMESYREIDQHIAAFQAKTQLHCPPGCGSCCESPHVEASPLEMLPLAFELFRQGKALGWLEQVSNSADSEACVFYSPDPTVPGNGRCQVYLWRPSICRLFGFATVKNRLGQPELAACVRHKVATPELVVQIQEAIATGLEAPNFAELSQQVANLDPQLGQQRLPINQALKVALQRVGLMLQMAEHDEP